MIFSNSIPLDQIHRALMDTLHSLWNFWREKITWAIWGRFWNGLHCGGPRTFDNLKEMNICCVSPKTRFFSSKFYPSDSYFSCRILTCIYISFYLSYIPRGIFYYLGNNTSITMCLLHYSRIKSHYIRVILKQWQKFIFLKERHPYFSFEEEFSEQAHGATSICSRRCFQQM